MNFIREFLATIASGLEIDSGDYEASLDKGLSSSTTRAYGPSRPPGGSGATRSSSVSASPPTSRCGLAPSRILGALKFGGGGWEAMTVRCLPTGTVQVVSGTSPHGQGHATTFSQIAADRLGVAVDEVEFLHGDTAVSQLGLDSYGSRSLAVGGVALWHAAEKIVAKSKRIAAHTLEVAEEDLEYETGRFTVRGPTSR